MELQESSSVDNAAFRTQEFMFFSFYISSGYHNKMVFPELGSSGSVFLALIKVPLNPLYITYNNNPSLM